MTASQQDTIQTKEVTINQVLSFTCPCPVCSQNYWGASNILVDPHPAMSPEDTEDVELLWPPCLNVLRAPPRAYCMCLVQVHHKKVLGTRAELLGVCILRMYRGRLKYIVGTRAELLGVPCTDVLEALPEHTGASQESTGGSPSIF